MSARQSLALYSLIAFAAGILVTDAVRERSESAAMQQIAGGVAYLAATDVCAADKPGTRAVQNNNGSVIDCLVYDNVGYGSAPRLIRSLTVPVLSHPLGGGQQ